jgi:hypothetical protein
LSATMTHIESTRVFPFPGLLVPTHGQVVTLLVMIYG